MSTKSEDQRAGLLLDVEEERKTFQQEFTLDEKIEAIDQIVSHILRQIMETATHEDQLHLAQVIVCHNVHREAVQYVAAKYKLNVVTSQMLPETEVFISSLDSVNDLLLSRFQKMQEPKK